MEPLCSNLESKDASFDAAETGKTPATYGVDVAHILYKLQQFYNWLPELQAYTIPQTLLRRMRLKGAVETRLVHILLLLVLYQVVLQHQPFGQSAHQRGQSHEASSRNDTTCMWQFRLTITHSQPISSDLAEDPNTSRIMPTPKSSRGEALGGL